jgi:hypothetical protein
MSELVQHKAANTAEAAEWILQAQLDHGEGIGPDLEDESIALAKQFGLDEETVRRGWARAKAKRAEAKADAAFRAIRAAHDRQTARNSVKPVTSPAIVARSTDWPNAPTPPADASAIERLTYPRGLLGHITQYIYDTDRLPDRVMALAGGLVTAHKALDRKVLGPGGIGLVLFLLLIV